MIYYILMNCKNCIIIIWGLICVIILLIIQNKYNPKIKTKKNKIIKQKNESFYNKNNLSKISPYSSINNINSVPKNNCNKPKCEENTVVCNNCNVTKCEENKEPCKKYNCNTTKCEENKEVVYDMFKPPIRRYNFDELPSNYINIKTRGVEEDFQLYGVLINTTNSDAFNLFGRKKFNTSNLYEYYISGYLNNNNIKLPIANTKELDNKQQIILPELGNAAYTVNLYETNNFKYFNNY